MTLTSGHLLAMPNSLRLAIIVLGGLVSALVSFLYGVVPLFAKRSQFLYSDREYIPTTPEDLNETAREGIRRGVQDLNAEGFEVVANHRRGGGQPGVVVIYVLFVNRKEGDFAEGFFVSTGAGETYRETWTLAIRTRFSDGFEIKTYSSKSATAFPKDRTSDSINVHWIHDGRMLYSIHKSRINRYQGKTQGRVLPAPGQEIEFMKEDTQREIERVVAAGYYVPDSVAGRYRMTTKGAYLMTWRLLWPLIFLRRSARTRRAQRELQKLGFAAEAMAVER